MTFALSGQIFEEKKTQTSNVMKIRPVGEELFHAGGQTDMTELKPHFSILRKRIKVKLHLFRILGSKRV